jgi:hypothetical protein
MASAERQERRGPGWWKRDCIRLFTLVLVMVNPLPTLVVQVKFFHERNVELANITSSISALI